MFIEGVWTSEPVDWQEESIHNSKRGPIGLITSDAPKGLSWDCHVFIANIEENRSPRTCVENKTWICINIICALRKEGRK